LNGNNITDQVEFFFFIYIVFWLIKTLIRIANLIKNRINLKRLSFENCSKITEIGGFELAEALKSCKTVEKINFSDCNLGDKAIASLIENID